MADLQLADGVAALPAAEWNELVGEGSPFLEWEWLASLEEAGNVGDHTGWQPRPLIVRQNDRLVAAAPLYLKAHSEGEFVFDWSWAEAADHAGLQYYPKMLVGVPFTPVSGGRLLVAPGQPRGTWLPQLAAALRDICLDNELSSVHVDFCRQDELPALEDAGYLVRIGIQYHWHNHDYTSFDDYLADFRSKRRNQIKRERRELQKQGVEIRALHGEDITPELFEPMFRFYLATINSRYWGRQYLNFELFELLRDRFRHRLVFIIAFQGGQPIAGTFNVTKGNALYGRYWGTTRPLRYLHFNVCYYAAVEYCIESGLARFEPGAGGEYKQLRGFDGRPTYSAHFLAEPRFSEAVAQFLDRERADATETLEWCRGQSALKRSV